jgi:hypothetical protein
VFAYHSILAKKFEEEMNNLFRGKEEKQLAKKNVKYI